MRNCMKKIMKIRNVPMLSLRAVMVLRNLTNARNAGRAFIPAPNLVSTKRSM